MVTREEIVTLGIAASLSGSVVGGIMLGAGIALALGGRLAGLALVCAAAPVAVLIGWLMARRLAGQLEPGPWKEGRGPSR
jgi:hypothetical protein